MPRESRDLENKDCCKFARIIDSMVREFEERKGRNIPQDVLTNSDPFVARISVIQS